MAAVKLVPLGQTAGQRLLVRLGQRIAPIAQASIALPDAQLSNFAPASPSPVAATSGSTAACSVLDGATHSPMKAIGT